MGFSFPFLKKKQKKSLYFGLYVTDATLVGFLFDTTSGTSQILSSHGTALTAGFDKILEDTDRIISEIEQKTTEHLDKTIFFLNSWMIDEQTFEIKEPYKNIVKLLAKDLELEPLGYIDVQEAVHEYLQKNAVLNTIAIEVNKTKLGVAVYKGGKSIYSQYTARTDTVGEDIQSVLKAIPGGLVMPTKILVYGDTDTVEVSTELAGYEWEDKIFAQHPTIEILKQQDLNEALALTFTEEVVSQSKVPTPDGAPDALQEKNTLKEEQGDSFGFVTGQDIKKVRAPLMQEVIIDDPTPVVSAQKLSPPLSRFSGFSLPKKPILIGVGVALILFLLMMIYEYFFHILTLTVSLPTQALSETFDIEAPVTDTETKEFAVVKRTTVQAFEDEKKTTGTREDGEKSKGEVEIRNLDKEARTFPRGTELRKGELVFSIDSETKVPAAVPGTATSETVSGKVTVSATADKIGPEYNIGKGSELSVASLSNALFTAFAESAFTGGSKKEVQTVSKADIDALAKLVTTKADKESAAVLGASVSVDEVILPNASTVRISDTTYSGEVGEEASKLRLKAESEVAFLTVKKAPFEKKLAELFQKGLEPEYFVAEDSLKYTITDVIERRSNVTMTVDAEGKAARKIDSDALSQAATFKSQSTISQLLAESFHVTSIESDSPLGFTPWTPLFRKNITVTTVSN